MGTGHLSKCSKASVPIYYLVNKDAYNKDSQIIPKILGEEKHTNIINQQGRKTAATAKRWAMGLAS